MHWNVEPPLFQIQKPSGPHYIQQFLCFQQRFKDAIGDDKSINDPNKEQSIKQNQAEHEQNKGTLVAIIQKELVHSKILII